MTGPSVFYLYYRISVQVISLLEPAVEDEFPPNVYPNTAPWKGCPIGDVRSECHLLYGVSLEKTEKYEGAVEHYRKALQYNPMCYEALENLNRREASIERKASVCILCSNRILCCCYCCH